MSKMMAKIRFFEPQNVVAQSYRFYQTNPVEFLFFNRVPVFRAREFTETEILFLAFDEEQLLNFHC